MNNLTPPQTPLTLDGLMASIYENDRFIREKFAETDRLIKANCEEIGGISKSNGEIAEAYFVSSFSKYPHFAGQDYQSVEHHKRFYSKELDLKDEYDLVLYNGTSVVIIEVKYNAKKKHVDQVLKKPATFKKLLPLYKDFTFYLGLAGLNVHEDAEKEAIAQGVAVIKQVGKKLVINDAHLRAF